MSTGGELREIIAHLIELDRGGYGLIPSSALDGAPAITAKKYLLEEPKRLKQGEIELDDPRAELEGDVSAEENDEYE